jgi:hypothetical protein
MSESVGSWNAVFAASYDECSELRHGFGPFVEVTV